MADARTCEQCGTPFEPRREHARFCSPPCRTAWNHEHTGNPESGAKAVQWSITAMSDTTERLVQIDPSDQARAFAAIGEAVWWVTIVDATLVRRYLEAYDRAMKGQAPADRELTEATLAGLRFVRNRIGGNADLAEFIKPGESVPGPGHITAWTWTPAPEPKPASRPPHGQPWETARYQAYQAQLAGHTIGETFTRAATFLKQTVAGTPALTGSQRTPTQERRD